MAHVKWFSCRRGNAQIEKTACRYGQQLQIYLISSGQPKKSGP